MINLPRLSIYQLRSEKKHINKTAKKNAYRQSDKEKRGYIRHVLLWALYLDPFTKKKTHTLAQWKNRHFEGTTGNA